MDTKNPKQVIEITLISGKELQEEPPKATKEADADVVTQHVNNRITENSRKSDYLKEKVAAEEVKKIPPLHFPQRHIKAKKDAMFKKFFDTFRGLHINLPLLDVLQAMPKYAKYLRDVMDNKVKL